MNILRYLFVLSCLPVFYYCFFSEVPSTFSFVKNGKDIRFKKTVLSSTFISEGVTVADVNNDGKKDVLAGAWWFEAPGWTRHNIAIPDTFTFDKGYSTTFVNFFVNFFLWIFTLPIFIFCRLFSTLSNSIQILSPILLYNFCKSPFTMNFKLFVKFCL